MNLLDKPVESFAEAHRVFESLPNITRPVKLDVTVRLQNSRTGKRRYLSRTVTVDAKSKSDVRSLYYAMVRDAIGLVRQSEREEDRENYPELQAITESLAVTPIEARRTFPRLKAGERSRVYRPGQIVRAAYAKRYPHKIIYA
jgi:hypothetical protein